MTTSRIILVFSIMTRIVIKLVVMRSRGNVVIGKNVVFWGVPCIKSDKHSSISIGDSVTLISLRFRNRAGMYTPCSLYATNGGEITIGENSGLSGVTICCANRVTIGCNVNIGVNVKIWDTDFHEKDHLLRRLHRGYEYAKSCPIVIKNDAWIGGDSIILKGVTIGENSIVGAGSIVTKNIPNGEIWGGNPAQFIKSVN